MIDTGAPLSVMSYSVGKSLHHALRPVAVTNNPLPKFQNGQPSGTVPQSSILEWDHAPTRLVELDVRLIDSVTGDQTGLLTLLAKWVQRPRPEVFNDKFILLGMHFLAINAGSLELKTQPWGMSGSIGFA